jgi:aerobic-type carbon monoxide dehydrogenase small subunit (CoxS/CutS family)
MTILHVNGREYQLEFQPHETLGQVLNKRLGLSGVRLSCEEGECGSCTVLLDGKPVNTCMVLAIQAEEKEILTIEGLGTPENLDPIQQAYIDEHGFQCSFCTPGFILSTKSLLDTNPHPEPDEIAATLSGHICRCGSYPKIIRSVLRAAELFEREKSDG